MFLSFIRKKTLSVCPVTVGVNQLLEKNSNAVSVMSLLQNVVQASSEVCVKMVVLAFKAYYRGFITKS